MKIDLAIIPHSKQRFSDQAGDWRYDNHGTLVIRASQLSEDRMSWCLLLHELIEAILCQLMGVGADTVDAWDNQWATEHPDSEDEAGDDPHAPYHIPHVIASVCERPIAFALGVDWNKYSEELSKLGE